MSRLPIVNFVIYVYMAVRNVIGSRASFVIASFRSSITLNYVYLGVIHYMPTA